MSSWRIMEDMYLFRRLTTCQIQARHDESAGTFTLTFFVRRISNFSINLRPRRPSAEQPSAACLSLSKLNITPVVWQTKHTFILLYEYVTSFLEEKIKLCKNLNLKVCHSQINMQIVALYYVILHLSLLMRGKHQHPSIRMVPAALIG